MCVHTRMQFFKKRNNVDGYVAIVPEMFLTMEGEILRTVTELHKNITHLVVFSIFFVIFRSSSYVSYC